MRTPQDILFDIKYGDVVRIRKEKFLKIMNRKNSSKKLFLEFYELWCQMRDQDNDDLYLMELGDELFFTKYKFRHIENQED